ncbi:MAG: response regulator [Desulfobulbaceae bacterium]|jgi:DNA-binding response OmpR family regulator|nr:MAG: response regulator [Desulfobulbaceae bacterium]
MRLLLVDDEKEFVTTLAERLIIRGFDVEYATKALDALDLVKENHFDLVILDMKMPGTSGLELKDLLEKIRPNMKYIFLTGHGSEEDYSAGLQQATHYLVKPVNISILINKINEAVNIHE